MKRRWLGIAICAAALLAAGCSSGTDVSRAADESDTGTAAGKASETTADTAAAKSEAGEDGRRSICGKGRQDPVEKKKVYVSPDWVQERSDGNQEWNQRIIWFWNAWGTVQDAAAYKEGHIKGAYHMNTDDIESEEYWNIRPGRDKGILMAEYGITKRCNGYLLAVIRARISGRPRGIYPFMGKVENVKCLDGGYEAWLKSGYGTEKRLIPAAL